MKTQVCFGDTVCIRGLEVVVWAIAEDDRYLTCRDMTAAGAKMWREFSIEDVAGAELVSENTGALGIPPRGVRGPDGSLIYYNLREKFLNAGGPR